LWKSVRRKPLFAGATAKNQFLMDRGKFARRVLEITFPHFFHTLWGSMER